MANPTSSAPGAESLWIEWLLTATAQVAAAGTVPTPAAVAAVLAAAHDLAPGQVLAWLAGCATLATLAGAPRAPNDGALEEEHAGVHGGLRAARPIVEWRLQARLADADAQQPTYAQGDVLYAPQGTRTRCWQSVLGPLTLRRRYFYAAATQTGATPADRAVGLPATAHTPFLEARCTRLAAQMPYRRAVDEVAAAYGVAVGVTAVERMVARRGAAVTTCLTDAAAALAPYEATGLPRVVAPPADAVATAPDVAYAEFDGVIAMTRVPRTLATEAADRVIRVDAAVEAGAGAGTGTGTGTGTGGPAPPPPAGRGGPGRRYTSTGREIKNAVLYDGAHCAPESPARGCLTEKRYVSHLGEWPTLAARVWAQMRRLRFDEARLVVVLSDGAEWVRSLAAWLPVATLLILDLYHVKHRIWEVAAAVYGDDTPDARAWAHAQNDRIEAGRAAEVLEALRFLRAPTATAAELVAALTTYLTNNLDRIDYPRYRALGLRVTTASVESGNYHVTGQRTKGQGMRWDADHLAHMALLRADLCNGDWDRRSRQIQEAAA